MRFTIYILLIFLSLPLLSQVDRCSFDEYRQILKNQGLYKEFKNYPSHYCSIQDNYTIPVVVHILYNNDEQNISDERVYSQIDVLNQDYNALNINLDNIPDDFQGVIADVGFSFCLVQKDLNGNSFSGINRVYTEVESFNMSDDAMKKSDEGGVDAWDSENYLNFWVCNLSGNLLGFATMPGDVSAELDGVVVDYEYFGVDLSSSSPYNLGRTATHEVGHYFNLEHTFYAGCSDWDSCDDTPSISSPTYGCPEFPQESCNSIDMTMNYMDYTNDACMHMFTSCQAELMIDALLTYRPNLITDADCSVSIDENIYNNDIFIHPNPVLDKIFLSIEESRIYLYDIYGREILSNYYLDKAFLDVSSLHSGTYIIIIDNYIQKFIKR